MPLLAKILLTTLIIIVTIVMLIFSFGSDEAIYVTRIVVEMLYLAIPYFIIGGMIFTIANRE